MNTDRCIDCGMLYVGSSLGDVRRCFNCREDDKMILDKCVVCGCTTEVDEETSICDGCMDNIMETFGNNEEEDKGMKFIDAIQKYEKITNDGGTTVYSKNSEGTIIMHRNDVGGGFQVNVDLLTSEGWQEYKEDKLILPKRFDYPGVNYYTISTINNIYTEIDQHAGIDTKRLDAYNYFLDEKLAQYVADRQLLFRVELTLKQLNKGKFPTLEVHTLVQEYIKENFKEVLDRIDAYEMRNRV